MEKFPKFEKEKPPMEKHRSWLRGARLTLEATGYSVLTTTSAYFILKLVGDVFFEGAELSPAVVAALSAPSTMAFINKRNKDLGGK